MNKLNLFNDPPDSRDYRLQISKNNLYLFENNIVKNIDHTEQMTPVKNQGDLGSCVAFALVALKEWQEKKEFIFEKYVLNEEKQQKELPEYNFSEQWLYYQAKKIDEWPDEDGTSLRYGLKILQKIGVPVEEGWAYNDIDRGHPENWAHLVARWNKIKSYHRLNNLLELKAALIDSPVVIGVGVFEGFLDTPDGKIIFPSRNEECLGGHAVCAVGFDDNNQLIKFKNSWGEEWGDSGYGYLSYKYVNEYMWDAWTCKDMRVMRSDLMGKQSEMFLY